MSTPNASGDAKKPDSTTPMHSVASEGDLAGQRSEPATESASSEHTLPRPKIAAISSFSRLWQKKAPEPEFPPRDWLTATGEDPAVNHAAAVPLPNTPAAGASDPILNSGTRQDAEPSSGAATPSTAPPPSTLAHRIRDLLSTKGTDPLPLPPAGTLESGAEPPPPPKGVDGMLAKLLASASVMNGGLTRGRTSVWDVLDRIRAPKALEDAKPATAAQAGERKEATAGEAVDEETDEEDDASVQSGVMVYGPLVPDADSRVELAKSETVEVDSHGHIVRILHSTPAQEEPNEGESGAGPTTSGAENTKKPWWAFATKKGAPGEEGKVAPSGSVDVKGKTIKGRVGTMVGDLAEKVKQTKEQKLHERRIWVPSPTQISFQVDWWGYRIYLPPPVLAVLDNKSIEATKRAAMLTTALQMILTKIPTALFPPQLRPAVMMAKKLLPYVGYLGGAIAWGWGAIRGFDKGHGVVLSATWLLPLALLPGTWEDNAFAAQKERRQDDQVHESTTPEASAYSKGTAAVSEGVQAGTPLVEKKK